MSIVVEPLCRRCRKSERMDFQTPQLCDASRTRALVQASGLYGNDLNFANLYLLQRKHKISLCFQDGFLFRRYDGPYRRGFGFPVGDGDWDAAISALEQEAQDRSEPLSFCLLTGKQKEILDYYRASQFQYKSDRGDADYVYLQDDLAKLPGRKYQRKRNAVHQFVNAFPDWRFERLDADTTVERLDIIDSIARRWYNFHEGAADPGLRAELEAIQTAISSFQPLNLTGGLLFAGDRPLAFSLASATLSDVFDIHFEKAIPEAPQAYAMICHATAQALASARLINREEDVNEPGLRKAKLAWEPTELIDRYSAREW